MADDKNLEGVEIAFVSGGLSGADIDLRGVFGREQLSRLFAFDLILAHRGGPFSDDDLDKLLGAPCAIAFGAKKGDVVHGLLERIELVDSTRQTQPRYLARMVPTVS